ncbi:MAG: DUF3352 domain-containing protein [Leptolyngbyaceae cyanobacterium]
MDLAGLKTVANRKTSTLWVAAGVAIALVTVGAAYWLLRQRQPTVADSSGLGDLSMVPDTALAVISVSTDESQWRQVRSLGTVETQTRFNRELALWRDYLLTENGLDYDRDIQPWIGEKITIVVFPPEIETIAPGSTAPSSPDRSTTDGSLDENLATGIDEPNDARTPSEAEIPSDNGGLDPELIDPNESQPPLLLLPIADPLKGQSILQEALVEADEGVKRDYNGVDIQEFSVDGDESYFATILDQQMLVLSTEDSFLEQVIDTHQGKASVLDIPGYNRAVDQVSTPQSFVNLYINSAIATPLIAANTVQATLPQELDFLLRGQGIAANLTVEDEGLTLSGVVWLKEGDEPFNPGKSAEQVLNKLPQDTLMMVAGSNFKQLWDTLDQRASEGLKGILDLQATRTDFQTLTGLNIDRDFVDWMTGGFAVALVSAPETPEADPTGGLLLMAEAGDRPMAEKTFARLDGVMRDRHQFQVISKLMEGMEVTNWLRPFNSQVVTRGWLDDTTFAMTFGNITETVMPKTTQFLADAPLFQQVMGQEASRAHAYFFADVETLTTSSKTNLMIPTPEQSADFVRAIGYTWRVQSGTTARFNITTVMPTLASPGTLPDLSSEKNQAGSEDETGPEN